MDQCNDAAFPVASIYQMSQFLSLLEIFLCGMQWVDQHFIPYQVCIFRVISLLGGVYRGVVKISVSHSVMYCRTALRSVFTPETIEYHTSNVATTFWRIVPFKKCCSRTKIIIKCLPAAGVKNMLIYFIDVSFTYWNMSINIIFKSF